MDQGMIWHRLSTFTFSRKQTSKNNANTVWRHGNEFVQRHVYVSQDVYTNHLWVEKGAWLFK